VGCVCWCVYVGVCMLVCVCWCVFVGVCVDISVVVGVSDFIVSPNGPVVNENAVTVGKQSEAIIILLLIYLG
jgi:hypothetical protein